LRKTTQVFIFICTKPVEVEMGASEMQHLVAAYNETAFHGTLVFLLSR
jgi:hypothetical protein